MSVWHDESVNRVIRYGNALIALLLLAALAGVSWYVYRPMPPRSGNLRASVGAPVRIERDSLGVPHISAATIDDALYAQGYAVADDRLFQLDLLRRKAAGELCEIVGPTAIELDRDARRLRMRRLAEEHAAKLPPADLARFRAFVRGVNASLDRQRAALPIEFQLLGYKPRPWTVADSMLVALEMYRTLTTSWTDDFEKAKLLDGGDRAKVERLYPIRGGLDFQPGSNAWAVSGKLTASGKPLLANDPHLAWSFPATWWQVHLKAGELDVTGAALPGLPGVIVGHNRRIAWGVTNLGYDVQDLYIEPPGVPARVETEIVAIKGAPPERLAVTVTRHGPVMPTGTRPLAMRWAAAEIGSFQYPMIELNLAKNFAEFRAALRRFPGPGQNFVYADIDGNIGYQATGMLPVRRTYNGDLPVASPNGENEWQGFIPFDELPSFYNPPSGTIVTANQNPWPAEPGFRLNGDFAPPYRARQIKARLEAKSKLDVADMLSVQNDVYAESLLAAGKMSAAAVERKAAKDASLGEAAKLLKSWDGQMRAESPAALIALLNYQYLRRALAERASPGKGAEYSWQMGPAVVENLLRERPADWFADWDSTLAKALEEAVGEARRKQGGDPAKWRYGVANTLELGHPVLSKIPYVGKYFRIGPVEMHGWTTTVKQTTPRIGPSMHFVADLSNWDASVNNIVVGQSGHVFSGHFQDQWKDYFAGRASPMPFAKIEPKRTLTLSPE